MTHPRRKSDGFLVEARSLLTLAWPLVGSNLMISAMNFADVAMAGRVSEQDLAAVGVGSSLWLLFFLGSQGLLTAISPIVAHKSGGGQSDQIGTIVRHGLLLSQLLALLVVCTLQLLSEVILNSFDMDVELRRRAVEFTNAISWGAPAMFALLVLKFAMEGLGMTRTILNITLAGFVFNLVGNVVFIYGYLGAPAMGGVGCGVASAMAMWLMLIIAAACVYRHQSLAQLRRSFKGRFSGPDFNEILMLGLPIAGTVLAENGFFIAITFVMSSISVSAVAAHQIAMSYTSMTYMVPMALAAAISIRVGQAAGEQQWRQARWRGWCGILVCLLPMTASALVLLVMHQEVATLYTNDSSTAAVAASLLLVAAALQISDGAQVACAGALRGLKDTRIPFLLCVASYWTIAFPLAWVAAHTQGASPRTVWWTFVIGLSVAAFLLAIRYLRITGILVKSEHEAGVDLADKRHAEQAND